FLGIEYTSLMKISGVQEIWVRRGISPVARSWVGRARVVSATLVLLVTCAWASGQAQQKAKVAEDSKEDIKQAQQLAARGDAAYSAGKMNEALADYQEAVKRAPADAG